MTLDAANLTSYLTDNVLDNEHLHVDFTPLYECIHIYNALDSLDEIRRSYQADRKVRLMHYVRCRTPDDHP